MQAVYQRDFLFSPSNNLQSRDHGEWTEDLAPTVSASLLALEAEEDASNAHLGHRDHQAQVDHQDRLVRQVDKDLQVQEPAAWDLRDHLVHLETQDHQVMTSILYCIQSKVLHAIILGFSNLLENNFRRVKYFL